MALPHDAPISNLELAIDMVKVPPRKYTILVRRKDAHSNPGNHLKIAFQFLIVSKKSKKTRNYSNFDFTKRLFTRSPI